MKLLFFILALLALAVAYVLYPKALTPTLPSKPKTQIAAEEISIPIPQITITFTSETSHLIADEDTIQSETEETSLSTEAINKTHSEALTPEQSTPSATDQVATQNTACSSPDNTGLATAFDRELGTFLNNAAATYGSQYNNLQYEISGQTITQHENQGTVSANYQGSVSEIATGDIIQASGGMTVNFSWDGCNWVLVDYTYW